MAKPDMLLWLSDARGIYIPRDFATSFADRAKNVSGVSDENWAILEAGPDHEHYWEAWQEVEQNAVITDDNGVKFRIHQDGDCWLVPESMEWSDEEGTFVHPEEDDEDEQAKAEAYVCNDCGDQGHGGWNCTKCGSHNIERRN